MNLEEELAMSEEFRLLHEEADALMEHGDIAAGITAFERLWEHPRCTTSVVDPCTALSVGLALGDARFRTRDFRGALDALGESYHRFVELATVVGNPFFHLRVGQCKYELATTDEARRRPGRGTAVDDLARALIGAGIELFDDEAPHYLEAVTAVLQPPVGFATWEAARGQFEGSSRDALACVPSYVRAQLERTGVLKPLRIEDFFR